MKYLEIGTWAGSTLLSFIYKQQNLVYASAIDDFSQFQEKDGSGINVRQYLEGGLESVIDPEIVINRGTNYEINFSNDNFKFQFLDSHCFELDKNRLFGKYNVYFFDGPHAYEDTKKGFTYYNDHLDDIFIVIIDDWNRDYIRNAWKDVSDELGYEICYEQELIGMGPKPVNPNAHIDWWNGYYVAVIKKT